MRFREVLAVTAFIAVGCGSAATTTETTSAETSIAATESPASALFDALPLDAAENQEILRRGTLVLVNDEAVAPFWVRVAAMRERSGETTAFQVTYGSDGTPSDAGFVCGSTRIGLLRLQPEGHYTFQENGSPDTDTVFDIDAGPGCDVDAPEHPANRIFDGSDLDISADNDGLLFTNNVGERWPLTIEDTPTLDAAGDAQTGTPVVTTVPVEGKIEDRRGPQGINSPTRLPGFEGLPLDEARRAALELGWEFIEVRDSSFEPPAEVPADYSELALGLYVEKQLVLEAWSGGYRSP